MTYVVPKPHAAFVSSFGHPVTGFRIFQTSHEILPRGSVVMWSPWGWADPVQPNPKVELATDVARVAGVLSQDLPRSVSSTTPTWGTAVRGPVQALVYGSVSPGDPLIPNDFHDPGVLIKSVYVGVATAMSSHTGNTSLCPVMFGVGQAEA